MSCQRIKLNHQSIVTFIIHLILPVVEIVGNYNFIIIGRFMEKFLPKLKNFTCVNYFVTIDIICELTLIFLLSHRRHSSEEVFLVGL